MKNSPRCEGCTHYIPDIDMPWIGSCAQLQEDLDMPCPVKVHEDFGCKNWECKSGVWEAEVYYV